MRIEPKIGECGFFLGIHCRIGGERRNGICADGWMFRGPRASLELPLLLPGSPIPSSSQLPSLPPQA